MFALSFQFQPPLTTQWVVKWSLKFSVSSFCCAHQGGWVAHCFSIVFRAPVPLRKVQGWQSPSLVVQNSMQDAGFTRWSLEFYGGLLTVCVGKPIYREVEGWWFECKQMSREGLPGCFMLCVQLAAWTIDVASLSPQQQAALGKVGRRQMWLRTVVYKYRCV